MYACPRFWIWAIPFCPHLLVNYEGRSSKQKRTRRSCISAPEILLHMPLIEFLLVLPWKRHGMYAILWILHVACYCNVGAGPGTISNSDSSQLRAESIADCPDMRQLHLTRAISAHITRANFLQAVRIRCHEPHAHAKAPIVMHFYGRHERRSCAWAQCSEQHTEMLNNC